MRYLIMCKSLTYAQRASRALESAGIKAHLLKAPAGLMSNGCGYCVSVSPFDAERAVGLLRAKNLPIGRIYLKKSDNSYQEVKL